MTRFRKIKGRIGGEKSQTNKRQKQSNEDWNDSQPTNIGNDHIQNRTKPNKWERKREN